MDTAPFYGWGRAEQIVGDALAGLDQRPVLLTKCGTVRRPDGGSAEDHRAVTLRADLDASLARLRCLYVDVLQLHDPDPAVPIETAWRTVWDLIGEGKVRAGSLSNHPVGLMERAQAIGPVSVVQHQYSLLHRAPESDGVLDWCAEHGVTFLAWSPLASGFLADGFALDTLHPGDFRHGLPWADLARLDLRQLRRELSLIGGEAGLSLAALSIGWIRAKGVKAIVGARTPAEAEAIASYRPLPPALQGSSRRRGEKSPRASVTRPAPILNRSLDC